MLTIVKITWLCTLTRTHQATFNFKMSEFYCKIFVVNYTSVKLLKKYCVLKSLEIMFFFSDYATNFVYKKVCFFQCSQFFMDFIFSLFGFTLILLKLGNAFMWIQNENFETIYIHRSLASMCIFHNVSPPTWRLELILIFGFSSPSFLLEYINIPPIT